MLAEIRSFSAFRVTRSVQILSSSLCLDSLAAEGSTVTVSGADVSRSNAGSWLVIGSRLYLIDKVTPQVQESTLSLVSPIEAFSRKLLYSRQPAAETVGGFITAVLRQNWVDQADGVYAIPYLRLSNLDVSTPFVAPELDDNGLFSLSDYIRQARRLYDVRLDFAPVRAGIALTVSVVPRGRCTVTPGDGHAILESAAYSHSGLAKITTVHPVAIIIGYDEHDKPIYELDDDGEKVYDIIVEDWYLSADGTVSSAIPAVRASGGWETIPVAENKDPLETASAKFAKNAESHKVEFWSDQDYAAGDLCSIKLYGEILTSAISYKGKRSTNSRWLYKTGELATTTAEKLKKGVSL